MRRTRAFLALAAVTALALGASPAGAHPLGNFSINHLVQVRISSGHVDLRYILDQAEIPTFQERGTPDAQVLALKEAEVTRRLTLTADGRAVTITPRPGAVISHPPGQGGLPLTRVELPLQASVPARGALVLGDQTFAGRVGWKAIVAQPGSGTSVRSSAPSGDPTGGLRSYPADLLGSPLNERTARFAVAPGAGKLTAPRGLGDAKATTTNRGGDGFAGVFANAAAGKGVLLLLLLAAFGWGAVHALSPGHGKAMVAAYLVGSRGTARHAAVLGLTVTVTHTVGVFILGLVTLLLSQYVLPEQLYPWLNLVSGLLVVLIGAGVLRARVRAARAGRAAPGRRDDAHAHPRTGGVDEDAHGHVHVHHADRHAPASGVGPSAVVAPTAAHELVPALTHVPHHEHGAESESAQSSERVAGGPPLDHHHDHHGDDHHGAHEHDGSHDRDHRGDHHHDHPGDHQHDHHGAHTHVHGRGRRAHSHEVPDRITPRGLLVMGASAGLIPCPSALVVLLGAIAEHQVALGLLLILAFSVGLAATLTGLGLVVVGARELTGRVDFTSPLVAALPAASAVVIIAVGCVLTARAIPSLV